MRIIRRPLTLFMALSFASFPAPSFSAEAPSVSLTTAESVRYISVNGDATKFRQLRWINDGFSGGISDAAVEGEWEDGVTLEGEGHAVPQNGDYRAEFTLKKEDAGYLRFGYDQFRKYYSNAGGFYRLFPNLAQNYTDKELALNIGKLEVEAGITMKNLPDIVLLYEREFKNGTKSRLSWTGVTDTVNGASVTKKTGPSWQEITEVVDAFDVIVSDTTSGFNWKADQHWEFVRSKNMREEQNLTAVATANASDSNAKIRDQFTEPRSEVIASTFNVDRWFWKEKGFVSSGYRFSQIKSRELENIFEYDQNRVLTNFSNAEQVRGAFSDNLLNSQTWVGSFMTTVFQPLTVIARIKAESANRNSESTYPKDKSPNNNNGTSKPDGAIDEFSVSNNQEKLMHWGESVSLRYDGIPRVALYNEYEFQQDRSNLYEDRQSVTAGETFNRQDIAHMFRGVERLGARIMPWDNVTLTVQGLHRDDDIRFNHVRYTNNSTSGAKSVFIDSQRIAANEAQAGVFWKLCKWFQPSFRYQLSDRGYETQGLSDIESAQKAHLTTNVYTWEAFSQPTDDFLLTASFSYQDGKMTTPARFSGTASSDPTFNFDSYSTLFSAEYALTKDVVLTGTANYTQASNFNDFSSIGMPYGADFHQADLIFGVRWTPKKDVTIEPKYGYYQYRSDGIDIGNYNAHEAFLEVKAKWG